MKKKSLAFIFFTLVLILFILHRWGQIQKMNEIQKWVEYNDGGLEYTYPREILESPKYMRGLLKVMIGKTVTVVDLEVTRGNSSLKSIYSLKDITSLERLYLTGRDVEDLSPLVNLYKLQVLNLQRTNIKDLSPLKNLSNLEVLDISQTKIGDLSPLNHLKKLRILTISKSIISDQEVINLKKVIPLLKVHKD